MIINMQVLTALLPFLALIIAIVVVIFCISFHRNHFHVATLTIFSLVTAFLTLYFSMKIVPININNLFYMTRYSIFYIGMIILSSLASCIFSYAWLSKYYFNKEEFYLLILLSTFGAIALSISSNMSSLFVNIELMSLPCIGLIVYSNYQKNSLEVAFKYFILSSVSSAFLLLGISWIYSVSGSLVILSISNVINIASYSEMLIILFGIIMILSTLFFKLSLVPFHLWIPSIYKNTSSSVLSFFAISGKIAIFSFLFYLFFNTSILSNKTLKLIFLLISIFSIFFGNLMAIFQINLKKFFGYSSISQIGYLLIVFLVSQNNYFFSLEAGIIYLFNYLLTNIVFFGCINLFSHIFNKNNNDIDQMHVYKGLFWSNPFLAIIFTIAFLSLSGIPITLGFWGKFYILSIIINNHLWVLLLFFLIGTILGFLGYLRLIINFYQNSSKDIFFIEKKFSSWCFSLTGIVIILCSILIIFFGLYPNLLINIVK